jgi:CheY-like chemotaxis protein
MIKILIVYNHIDFVHSIQNELKIVDQVKYVAVKNIADIEDHTPDIIVLDYNMPNQDWKTVISNIRQIPQVKQTPISIIGESVKERLSDLESQMEYIVLLERIVSA